MRGTYGHHQERRPDPENVTCGMTSKLKKRYSMAATAQADEIPVMNRCKRNKYQGTTTNSLFNPLRISYFCFFFSCGYGISQKPKIVKAVTKHFDCLHWNIWQSLLLKQAVNNFLFCWSI